MTQQPITIYLSYAQQDEAFKQELVRSLSILRQAGLLSKWEEHCVQSGADWSQVIDPRLDSADITLILLSLDMLGSGYCSGAEVQEAFKRHNSGKTFLIPIILRRVDLTGFSLRVLQSLPSFDKESGNFVTGWSDRDEAWWNVERGIRRAIEMITHFRSES